MLNEQVWPKRAMLNEQDNRGLGFRARFMAPGRSRRGRGATTVAAGPASLLAEARKLKQQAERKAQGVSREPLLSQSAGLFEAALKQQLAPDDYEECLFDLAETFLLWASSVKASASTSSPLRGSISKSIAVELQMHAFIRAADLCRQSFEAYEKVRALSDLKHEATVNSGNSLCDWAEMLLEIPDDKGGGVQLAAKLYSEARTRYSEALLALPHDIETLTNLGDCYVKLAELSLQEQGTSAEATWASAKLLYDHALQAYSQACFLADARKGDDICGLLQNWGAGFVSKAKHTPDLVDALELFNCAREKLRGATKFNPTDPNIFNALGELYIAESERYPDEQPLLEQVIKALLEAIECFTAALKINSSNIDALLGIAEAHHLASRSSTLLGNFQRSAEHSVQSANNYLKCIELLKSDAEGSYDLNFVQQCEVLYNLACAAALCGRESDAAIALKQLVQVEGITADEANGDPDLETLKRKDWFLSLMSSGSK